VADHPLLSIHGQVLRLLDANNEITQADLAAETGVSRRTISRVIVDLKHDGYIEGETTGRALQITIQRRRRVPEGGTLGNWLKRQAN